jgi:CheY-like chemotaxis protein
MGDKTILVIEDNELNMKLVRSLLKMSSYGMIEAGDAETGIKLAREKKPDLILMDIQLPGMDGLSATKILKADPSLKDTMIIALTSHAMEGDDKKVREAGCDGYITKPIDTRNFLQTVDDYLNGPRDAKRDPKREMPKI